MFYVFVFMTEWHKIFLPSSLIFFQYDLILLTDIISY